MTDFRVDLSKKLLQEGRTGVKRWNRSNAKGQPFFLLGMTNVYVDFERRNGCPACWIENRANVDPGLFLFRTFEHTPPSAQINEKPLNGASKQGHATWVTGK